MRSPFHTLASSIVIPTTSTLGPQTSKCNSCPPANFQPGKVYWLPASSRVLPSCSRSIPQVTSSLGTRPVRRSGTETTLRHVQHPCLQVKP